MKILFVTQEDPIYVAEFWEEFIRFKDELKEKEIQITGLVSLAPLGKSKKISLFKRVYGMYGFLGSFKLSIKYLKYRKKRKLEKYAKIFDIPYFYIKKVNSKNFIEKATTNDLIISVAAPKKFGKKLLEAPKYGCINIHSGPLPKYQGMMPVFWQMKDGKQKIGITIHKMNEELDKGEIIFQKFVDIKDCRSLNYSIIKTKHYAARMMKELILNFDKYYYNADKNDASKATYCSFPTKKDVMELKEKGKTLI